MTCFLLDVNVLIALVDPAHIQHDAVHEWFAAEGRHAFATCPITENGLLRILGHPKYPNSPGPPCAIVDALKAIRRLPGHTFWPDDLSLVDTVEVDPHLLTNHARVTDIYLLALARARQGMLATLDKKMVTQAVTQGDRYLMLI